MSMGSTRRYLPNDPRGIALAENIWVAQQQVSLEENNALLALFDEAEVEAFIKSTNTASAPGPDDLPVCFF
jgi:hypothetical protein